MNEEERLLVNLDERITFYETWIKDKPKNDLTMMAYISLDILIAVRALFFRP
jgi:hypothetical protein